MDEKACSKCRQTKPISEFYRNQSRSDGLADYCKVCWNAYEAERWRANLDANRKKAAEAAREKRKIKNPERFAQRQRLAELRSQGLSQCATCGDIKPLTDFGVRTERGSGIISYCTLCRQEKQRRADAKRDRTAYSKQHYANNRECMLAKAAEWRRALRRETLARYGGCCQCCRESIPEFLCLDHIDGGGVKHRRALGKSGTTFYSWLRKQGYPDGYRVLCHNCNQSLGYWGYCPHQV